MMPEQDTHVFHVQAQVMKLKGVDLIHKAEQDLTCCFLGDRGGPGVILEELDYHRSKIDRVHHETKQEIPAGSYYILVDVEGSNYVATKENIQHFADLATGKKVVMETLDPRDSNKRLQFRFWSHDEPARDSFEQITNQMEKIAIAATGL